MNDTYSNRGRHREELQNSPPYESYEDTNTRVDNNAYTQASWDASSDSGASLASQRKNPKITVQWSQGDGSTLESQPELVNQKRWFTFLFSKKVPPVPSPEERKPYPWKHVDPVRRVLFWWLWPILVKGYKRTVVPDDLWRLTDDLKVENMHSHFEENLSKRLDDARRKHLKKNESLNNFSWPPFAIPLALFDTFALQYTLSCIFLGLSFCCQALSPLLTRRLIDFVEDRYFGFETTYNKGIGYTIGAVILIFINGLLLNHFFHKAMVTGAQCKAILTKSLLLKSFKLSAKSRSTFPVGIITSLMSTDLARIDLAIGFQPLVVCFPIPVIIAVCLLLTSIGVTSLTGIGLFIVSLIICVLLTKKLFNTREDAVDYTDKRISLMREVLNNLKIIKFYAWEIAYKLNITKVREKEMTYLFTIKVLRNFVTAYAVTLPTLSSMLSFVTMWATGSMKSPGRVFSSLSLFSILAQAIMLLPIALATGADALIGFRRCRQYLSAEELDDKLSTALSSPEGFFIGGDSHSSFVFKTETVEISDTDLPVSQTVIDVRHADFFWEVFVNDDVPDGWEESEAFKKEIKKKKRFLRKNRETFQEKTRKIEELDNDDSYSKSSNETCCDSFSEKDNTVHQFPGLKNVNLTIQRGDFVVVTGSIGSGKSSLLAALAGELKLANPRDAFIKIDGKLMFCSSPWIQNATVRENIIFGKEFDPIKYNRVLDVCCLQYDLRLLPAGDLTEIGERGITLSGGQKARINLARACYTDSDILLFDDVLSAVDSRVGKIIVDKLFNNYLKGRTRILATHQLSLVKTADRIVYLNGDGTIDCGSLNELSERNNQFKRLLDFGIDLKRNSETELHQDESNEFERFQEENLLVQAAAPSMNDPSWRVTVDEDKAVNAISWDIYKKYINLGSGIFGFFAIPIFLLLISLATFCQLFTNTWLSFWMERKFASRSDNFYVAFYVLFAFLTVIFTGVEFTMLAYMNNRSAKLLNVKAVEKILHVPLSYTDTNPLGRILNRFTKDTDSLDNEIGEQLRLFLFPLATIIGIIILCICYLPWFAIAVPFLGFGFIFFANFYQGSAREIKRIEAVQRSCVYNNFNETLTGMSTIKAYKAEGRFIKRNDVFINRMNEAYFLSIATQRWLCVHLDIIASIFALIISLLCITDQFNISASSTGLLLNYVIQIVGLLSLTIRAMTQVENEMNSAERLHEYAFHLPQEATYKKEALSVPEEWPPSGYIEFKDVSLRYRQGLPLVLKNLTLNVYPGEKIGICGRTGAGKSSIMSALYRLVELETGSIHIDGLDISHTPLYDLRSRLSIIPQDPVLFQGTIRKNLDPFNQSTDENLWDALRRSGLIEEHILDRVKMTKLDHHKNVGYEGLHKFHLDQNVADDGTNFSLGEKQLLALARALVRNSKILILDEATSSVDYQTDAKIQETIINEFSHCTILCIAHRLRTILHYDRIIVMDHGELVQKGAPTQLYSVVNSPFRSMCDRANITAEDFERSY